MNSIGLLGNGFIGKALYHAFCHYTDVKVYDIDPKLATHTHEEVLKQDILFVAVPSPMKKNGDVDLSILEKAIENISDGLPSPWNQPSRKPVVIKSTVPPGSCQAFQNIDTKSICILLNPEFLTEKMANLDMIQQTRVILGAQTDELAVEMVRNLYKSRFPRVPIVDMTWDEASLVKYYTNVFFCTKIGIFNEMAQVTERLGFEPDKIIEEVLNDGRIGRSHWMVPGTDGKLGFGGSCFPKDLNGFIRFAKKLGVKPTIAKAVWEKNLEVRPEKDWEKLKGRAVSDG